MFTLSEVALDVCYTSKSGIGYIFTLPKVALDAFSLLKVELDVCFHFQKCNKIFVYTFKNGIGCMFPLSKVGLDICSYFPKWHRMYVYTSKSGKDVCLYIYK